MIKNKKSQAAVEFLSTYGWAVLVLLVGIAIFSTFLLRNPADAIPDSCVFNSGFECVDFQLSSEGLLSVNVRNIAGDAITINRFSCTDSSASEAATELIDLPLDSDTTTILDCPTGIDYFQVGEKANIEFQIVYTIEGNSFPNSAKSNIIATISSP